MEHSAVKTRRFQALLVNKLVFYNCLSIRVKFEIRARYHGRYSCVLTTCTITKFSSIVKKITGVPKVEYRARV